VSNWADALRLALRLGLAPEVFWRLSLAEWRALTEAPPAGALPNGPLRPDRPLSRRGSPMSFEPDDFATGGLSAVPARAAEAAASLEALKAPAERAARSIDEAFARAGASLVRSLARAASDGQLSLGELARAVLGAAGAALKGGGLGEALSKGFSGVGFSGARADGGPVLPGGAYLVGERGPEVFRPHGAGTIEPAGSGGVSVTVNVQGGEVGGLVRSDAQLAQALARAVGLGVRKL
jgi:hypothetical protein